MPFAHLAASAAAMALHWTLACVESLASLHVSQWRVPDPAAPLALLRACLGLEFDCHEEQICFHRPTLPDFLDRAIIRSLSIGESRVDILLQRHASDVSVNVLRRVGSAEVMVKQ